MHNQFYQLFLFFLIDTVLAPEEELPTPLAPEMSLVSLSLSADS